MSCVYQSAPGLAPDPEVWACHNPLLSLKIRGHTRLSSQNTSLQNGPTWGKQRGSVRWQACGQELTIKPSVPMKPGNVDIEIILYLWTTRKHNMKSAYLVWNKDGWLLRNLMLTLVTWSCQSPFLRSKGVYWMNKLITCFPATVSTRLEYEARNVI